MAHVKVVRRSMSTEEWISLRLGWLARHIIEDSAMIEGWQVREGRQVSEMTYEYYDADFRPLKEGDWIFSPDGSTFLRAESVIPERMRKREVWLQLRTAAEMIVKVNDQWAGGLDPNRDRLLISPFAAPDGSVRIEIEGYNRSKPDDERNPESSALRGCRQRFTGGRFVVVDEEILSALYDLRVLFDAMNGEALKDDVRDFLKVSLHEALNLVDYEETDVEAYRKSVSALRAFLKDRVFSDHRYPGSGEVALVSHSHLDIAYYWRRVHSVQKNARTCLIQLRLMDRYPVYKYAHSQAYTFEMLEKYYPAIFEEVSKRVAEGRFEPVGAMYVESDCNIPTAESLVRQFLYGQLYYRSRFGRTVENCWLPDVFGNSWIMPQILRKSGVRYFVSNKMSTWNDTNRFPHNHFIWKGIDGSEVFACVPPTHFITWNSPQQIVENWESFQDKDSSRETLNMFGYGDGGSGATEEMLEYLLRLNDVPGMPRTRHITGDQFLKENFDGNDRLKVWDGELYLEMHRGTFTTKAELKKGNRRLEILLRDAELLSALAAMEGHPYPHDRLQAAWKKLLVNQFHDILPGTHIPPVTRDALADFADIEAEARALIAEAAVSLGIAPTGISPVEVASNNQIACQPEIVRGEPSTLVRQSGVRSYGRYRLLNTLAWDRSDLVFIEGEFGPDARVDEHASQVGERQGVRGIWVDPGTIPSVGYRTIEVTAGGLPIGEPISEPATAVGSPSADRKQWFTFDGRVLETDQYRLRFERDGSISSLYDKACDRESVADGGALNKLRIYRDNPGTYDAWDISADFRSRQDPVEVEQDLTLDSWGPIFVALSVVLRLKESRWRQTIRVYRGRRQIDFENDVDWHETNRMAKAEFATNILARQAKCDTSAGSIVRETHQNTSWQQARFEVCHHKWADLSETGYGLSIINDGKYGISFDKGTFALSLLRSPVRPDVNSDRGRHVFTYSLVPHLGSPEDAAITKAGWFFNAPVLAFYLGGAEDGLRGAAHPARRANSAASAGTVAPADSSDRVVAADPSAPASTVATALEGRCVVADRSFISSLPDNLHLQSLKLPEDEGRSGTVIFRLVEVAGSRGHASLSLERAVDRVEALNLLEDLECRGGFTYEGNVIHFSYSPFEILTFQVHLR